LSAISFTISVSRKIIQRVKAESSVMINLFEVI